MNISSMIIFSFLIAFILTFIATPFVKKLAIRFGAIDVPKDSRRMHKNPTPLWGGLAMFFGFIVSVFFFAIHEIEIIAIILGATILIVMGMFDDVKPINPYIKFAIQILASLIPISCGVVIKRIAVPSFLSQTGFWELGWFAIPVTVFWIVGITNALNLMDGLDGLTAGVVSISSMSMLYISLIVSEPNIALITAALVGACFGFLPYNFNPAKIFMGDTGSLFLGFILSTLSIQGLFKGYAVISFAVPLLILALPIFDTLAAMLRRIKNKKPIMSPDRAHLHHRLVDVGFSQKQTVCIIYTVCALLGLLAIILVSTGAVRALSLAVIILAFLFFIGVTPYLSDMFSDNEDDENDKKN